MDASGFDFVNDSVLRHHLAQFVGGHRIRWTLRDRRLVENQHEIRRAWRGGTHYRSLVALSGFDRDGVKQGAVDDGVVTGERN